MKKYALVLLIYGLLLVGLMLAVRQGAAGVSEGFSISTGFGDKYGFAIFALGVFLSFTAILIPLVYIMYQRTRLYYRVTPFRLIYILLLAAVTVLSLASNVLSLPTGQNLAQIAWFGFATMIVIYILEIIHGAWGKLKRNMGKSETSRHNTEQDRQN